MRALSAATAHAVVAADAATDYARFRVDSVLAVGPGYDRGRAPKVESPRAAATLLAPMGALDREVRVVVALDARYHVVAIYEAGVGSVSSVVVDPRDVAKVPLMSNSRVVILAHNHPSGDPSPSDADLAAAAKTRVALGMVGIYVLDDLVIGRGRYVSLRARGHLGGARSYDVPADFGYEVRLPTEKPETNPYATNRAASGRTKRLVLTATEARRWKASESYRTFVVQKAVAIARRQGGEVGIHVPGAADVTVDARGKAWVGGRAAPDAPRRGVLGGLRDLGRGWT